jgi:hypothetical protein
MPRYTPHRSFIASTRQEETTVRTNLDTGSVADVSKGHKRLLRRVSAELGNRLGHVLFAAHRLDVGRLAVRVDGTEEAARGAGYNKGSKGEKSRGEEATGVHVGGSVSHLRMFGTLLGRDEWEAVKGACFKMRIVAQ